MFSKILIANRGEIAVRIIRACKEMGIASVAVYSEADKDTLPVFLADESYCIGPAPAEASYLNEDAIISAAILSKASAIHPGYGFLSENAHFAKKCMENGIAFIGPSPETMDRLSDKTLIKSLAKKAGLKVIPGTDVLGSSKEAVLAAEKIGFPVMLKARSGGGGRGIRLIRTAEELQTEYPLASLEAETAFSDPGLYLEKFIYPAKHIEAQILADKSGKVLCFGERDCSIQRNNQKLIEESPSPSVSRDMRADLIGRVTKAVKEIGYVGAGTLEFLLDKDLNFWFMEMNVRLQVEHGVSEMLTHHDLVKWQIRVAAGLDIPYSQEDIPMRGSTIECRINAKAPGELEMLHVPGGPFVRFDSYLVSGVRITPYYDPLIGKMIAYSSSREKALRKMRAALCELVIEGIDTNIEDQLNIIDSEPFITGMYDLTTLNNLKL